MTDAAGGRGSFGRWPLEVTLALRYLRSARADALISLLSRIAAGGLVLGVAALILALSALSGFQQRLLRDVRSRTPQLQVAVERDADVEALRAALVQVNGVARVQLVHYGMGWVRHGSSFQAVEVVGYEHQLPTWLPQEHHYDDGGVVLPATLAERWGLRGGEPLEVISPRMTLTPAGPQPRSRRLPLTGTHDPGAADERNAERLAMPLELGASLVGGFDRWLDLTLLPGVDERALRPEVERVASAASPAAAPQVRSWRDTHRALLFVLRLEKSAIFLAVVLIVLVASFAHVAALSLILASKRAEVGILGAMGAAPKRMRRVFLLVGGLLAVSGTLGGVVLGVGVAVALDRLEILSLPGDVYIVDHVPFAVRAIDVSVVLLSTFAVTLLAALIGSRRAALLQPVEALQR